MVVKGKLDKLGRIGCLSGAVATAFLFWTAALDAAFVFSFAKTKNKSGVKAPQSKYGLRG
jgi:hypothetical protein